jgi:hypothetical protein
MQERDDAPSVVTAVEEQLALKVVPDRAPLRVPVVGHVERQAAASLPVPPLPTRPDAAATWMIHYNVWFSFREGTAELDALARVRQFLLDLKHRNQIHDFKLLRNRAEANKTRLARFHALISFTDKNQFGPPFQEVATIGIHAGPHGFMIENVDTFIVETFEEIPPG